MATEHKEGAHHAEPRQSAQCQQQRRAQTTLSVQTPAGTQPVLLLTFVYRETACSACGLISSWDRAAGARRAGLAARTVTLADCVWPAVGRAHYEQMQHPG
ncbi:MAG TPA: hypothetical protein VGF67_06220 [Ktedonobacteraceae bacterium]